jgi:hypothetical protein
MAESNPSLKITKVPISDSALWNQFVDDSPQGTFFHKTTWADILSNTFERSYDIILCLKNKQPVGGMIFFRHKKYIWNMITPTAFFPYCAPIFYRPVDEKPQKTISNQLSITEKFESYLRENYDYWVLDVPANSIDVRPYVWKGARIEPQYSYVVSLKNKDQLYENFNQSVRRKLKQAQVEKASIIESTDPKKLLELVVKSYSRHGMKPLVGQDHLNSFLKKVMKLSQARLYYLDLKGNINAGRLVIIDKLYGYDLLSGSEESKGFGSTFLTASILEKYAGKIEQFDFLGANHPQIEEFKRGFGGELTQGFRVTNKIKIPLSWIVRFYRHRMKRERIL